jgi:lipopolysaccharide export system permease protein
LLYYFFVSAAKALGKDGPYPPAIGLWLPNIIFGVLAVIFWIKTARESPFKPILLVQRGAELLASWVKTRFQS